MAQSKHILLIIFNLILFFIVPNELKAREVFEVNSGSKIRVLSDKQFRKSTENVLEAVGNVVILMGNDTAYGEFAKLNLLTGEAIFEGNVRYVGQSYTLWGSKINYNIKTQKMIVDNARIIASGEGGDFSVVGDKVIKLSSNKILAEKAEYTTCKDCPESWSVYGDKIDITMGEYVHIKNALMKINGISIMYFPYIIFPIKNKRQTGLLFPKISFSLQNGVGYRQPFFWAINDHSDLKLTTSFDGERGTSVEESYRLSLAPRTWFELNSLQVNDRIYFPGKNNDDESGTHYFRFVGEAESHLELGHNFNSHFTYTTTKDFDVLRDFSGFTDGKVHQNSLGLDAYVNQRFNLFDFNLSFSEQENVIVDDPRGKEKTYVQVKPDIHLEMLPINIIDSKRSYFSKMYVGIDGRFTNFEQKQSTDGTSTNFIRNTQRLVSTPYVKTELLSIGAFNLDSLIDFKQTYYHFPDREKANVPDSNYYRSSSRKATTTLEFEVDRIIGLAYEEKIPIERVKFDESYIEEEKEKKEKEQLEKEEFVETIGSLTNFNDNFTQTEVSKIRNSYRHLQKFQFIHHYLDSERSHGSHNFSEQIESSAGQFDFYDQKIENVHKTEDVLTATSISQNNTIEFVWNNSLIKKTQRSSSNYFSDRTLRDLFSYSRISHLNISQGYDLTLRNDSNKKFKEKITRLYLNTGLSIGSSSVSFSEYYFWATKKKKYALNYAYNFSIGKFSFEYRRDTNREKSEDFEKSIASEFEIRPISLLTLRINQDYDLQEDSTGTTSANLDINPSNECWKVQLAHTRNKVSRDYSINFLVKFSKDEFTPLTGK